MIAAPLETLVFMIMEATVETVAGRISSVNEGNAYCLLPSN
uniref:Uncharacterized protein n=1 Tax=Arundo donax TaxID=35708 RepID=A0A0A9BE97_ARUDO